MLYFAGTIADGPRMKSWWDGVRTMYGRATKEVSGQPAKKLTARDEFLKEHLKFIRSHVYRVPKRSGIDVSNDKLVKLTDWLTDWLTDGRTDGLTDWVSDWLTDMYNFINKILLVLCFQVITKDFVEKN